MALRRYLYFFALLVIACAGLARAAQPLPTVPVIDLPRYLGKWFEIAKLPNWFQRKCVAKTRAEYSLRSDGSMQVTNRCTLASGKVDEAIGTARQRGSASICGFYRVRRAWTPEPMATCCFA